MIRSESLKKNQDFKVVYQNGTSYANRLLVMYVLKNQHMKNRLGISVSKKVGNSVVRHRLTRLIRESYRLNETDFDNNRAKLFCLSVESPDEIDIRRAQEAKERAEEQLRQKQSIQEYHMNQMALARAMTRLKVTHKQ